MAQTENKLGLWTSSSLVTGNMIGAGVFLMPATIATYGSISLVGWLVGSVGAFLLAKIFSHLSRMMPNADGGPYAYSKEGLGDFAGFLVAWGYLLSTWTTNAALAVAMVGALSTFFPVLAFDPMGAILTGLGAIWLITWINTRGIVTSGKFQLASTILKIVPLIVVSVGGLFFLDFDNFTPFNSTGTSDFTAITTSSALIFFAFVGVECATIPSGSVANPEKTISRATIIGTLTATVIYILSSVSIMGLMPASELAKTVTPFADAAVLMWGNGASYLVSIGVVIAALGALNGFILIQGQIPFAVSKDKLFPPIFRKLNKNGVPAIGIVIGSIVVSIMMIMNYTKGLADQFKFLILLSTLTVLIPYLFSSAAYIAIKVERNYIKVGWNQSVILATLAFIFSLWMVVGSGQETVYYGFILLMAGIPFYIWRVWKNKKSH